MAVPEDIRKVERPKNTVVMAYGKNKNLYAVKQRTGCRYVKGRRLPVTGPTIGHIVDMKYVPISTTPASCGATSDIELKEWGGVSLCNALASDLLSDLRGVYSPDDALKLYCIALLRVCHPGAKDCELKELYDDSFLSELHPDVALSKNTVSKFLKDVGKKCTRIAQFMRKRAETVGIDAHLLVDGTLKSNDSRVNTLSDFSRKAPAKGRRDISVIYAFDLERNEPVCSKCFPGNMLDLTAYEEFVSDCGVTHGLIVADKGFPSDAASGHFERNPDLHYLNPVKRNSRFIETHDLLSFSGILEGFDGVTYKKAKCNGANKWLYSFRDAASAAKEELDWLSRAGKERSFKGEKFKKRQKTFGTVVLECDKDLPPETVYKAYSRRWEIEIVMKYYKSACEFDETRVHNDYSVIASEFCDFLATVMTYRLINKFTETKLLEKKNYGKIMSILRRAKKVKADNGGWRLIKMNPSQVKILESLKLLEAIEEPVHRPVGRPPKPQV